MMRRPIWLGAGVVIGVGATVGAEAKVKRAAESAVRKLTPEQMAASARHAARKLQSRVSSAIDAGREARAQREDELWRELDGDGREPAHAPLRRPLNSAR